MLQHIREAAIPVHTVVLRSLSLLLPVAMLAGCASNRPVGEPGSDQARNEPRQQSAPWSSNDQVDETLGERLGRLDAQMKTAPADSLPILRAEYDRLVGEAAGPGADTSTLYARPERAPEYRQEQVATGDPAPETHTSTPRYGNPDTIATGPATSNPLGGEQTYTSIPSGTSPDTTALAGPDYTSTPRRTAGTGSEPDTALVGGALDPRLFHGLREKELRSIPGYRAPARATSSATRGSRPAAAARRSTAAKRPTVARVAPRRSSERQENRSTVPAAPRMASRTHQRAKVSERDVVEGIAAERAGKYSEAAKRFEAAKGGVRTPEARYSRALSLEKTGDLARAASEYLALSGSGGALGHKAYIGYCRVLSRQGQRGKARELVQRFIRQNPDSSQVGSARRLLQSL